MNTSSVKTLCKCGGLCIEHPVDPNGICRKDFLEPITNLLLHLEGVHTNRVNGPVLDQRIQAARKALAVLTG